MYTYNPLVLGKATQNTPFRKCFLHQPNQRGILVKFISHAQCVKS